MSSKKKINWNKQPLGKVSDRSLAKKLGVAQPTVWRARTSRGIQAYPRSKVLKVTSSLKKIDQKKQRKFDPKSWVDNLFKQDKSDIQKVLSLLFEQIVVS